MSTESSALTITATTAPPLATGTWNRIRRSVLFVMALTLALVISADLLFYGSPIGWTLALYALLLGLAVTARSANYLRSWPGRLIGLAFLGLCLALVEHPSFLRITLALAALMSMAILNHHRFTTHPPAWLMHWLEFVIRTPVQGPQDGVLGRRWRRGHGAPSAAYERLLVNWAVPLVLSVVFIALFAIANPIISQWIANASRAVQTVVANFTEYVAIGRVFLWLLVGLAVWGLLRVRTRWAKAHDDALIDSNVARFAISSSLLVRCLVLFNLVFGLQLALDLLTVLSAGATLPEGMTYSEYARRGAYPLVATALLAAAFVLMTFPSAPAARRTEDSRSERWARRLVYLWIGQNIVLTVTAAWRLWMYVEAFGLTRLRTAAAIWMLLVTLGLVYIIWRIVQHKSNAWLMRINSLTLIIVLYACCFINFDRIIAWHGVENSIELGGNGPRADLAYLRRLGIDAIPTLEWFAAQLDQSHPVGQKAQRHADELRARLDDRLSNWRGWTLRRAALVSRDVPTTRVGTIPAGPAQR